MNLSLHQNWRASEVNVKPKEEGRTEEIKEGVIERLRNEGEKDPRKEDKRKEERERVVFYHPRDSSFSQIRDRKHEATGNCFT